MKSYNKGILVGILMVIGSLLLMGVVSDDKTDSNPDNINVYNQVKENRFQYTVSPGGSYGIVIDGETGDTWLIKGKEKIKHEKIKSNK